MFKTRYSKMLAIIVIAGIAVAGLWQATAWAEHCNQGDSERSTCRAGGRGGEGACGGGGPRSRGGHGRGVRGRPMDAFSQLELTDEQTEQMQAIMAAARQQIHDEVLTDEQRAKLEELKQAHGERMLAHMTERYGLTDEQVEQIKTIMAAAHAEGEAAETREGKWEIMKAAFEQIKTEVLTDEQRAAAEEHRQAGRQHFLTRISEFLEMTEEQKAQAEAILTAAKAEAEAAETREAKWEIMKAAFEQIKAEVLTDEQRARAEQFRQRGRGRHGHHGQGEDAEQEHAE